MSATFSIRIPRTLKKKMEQNPADWDKEIRSFLEERINQLELMKTLSEVEARAEKRKTKIDSTTIIKESRDR
jgi:hypothetical protein